MLFLGQNNNECCFLGPQIILECKARVDKRVEKIKYPSAESLFKWHLSWTWTWTKMVPSVHKSTPKIYLFSNHLTPLSTPLGGHPLLFSLCKVDRTSHTHTHIHTRSSPNHSGAQRLMRCDLNDCCWFSTTSGPLIRQLESLVIALAFGALAGSPHLLSPITQRVALETQLNPTWVTPCQNGSLSRMSCKYSAKGISGPYGTPLSFPSTEKVLKKSKAHNKGWIKKGLMHRIEYEVLSLPAFSFHTWRNEACK